MVKRAQTIIKKDRGGEESWVFDNRYWMLLLYIWIVVFPPSLVSVYLVDLLKNRCKLQRSVVMGGCYVYAFPQFLNYCSWTLKLRGSWNSLSSLMEVHLTNQSNVLVITSKHFAEVMSVSVWVLAVFPVMSHSSDVMPLTKQMTLNGAPTNPHHAERLQEGITLNCQRHWDDVAPDKLVLTEKLNMWANGWTVSLDSVHPFLYLVFLTLLSRAWT